MAFLNLFFKSEERGPAEHSAAAVEHVLAEVDSSAAAVASPGPMASVEEPKDDGPIHLPHRGLPPFRPQTSKVDGPLHIPYRGLAPFKPAPVETGVKDTSAQASSGVLHVEKRTTGEREDVLAAPADGKQLNDARGSSRPAMASVEEEMREREVRERPRESKKAVKPRVPRHSSGWAAMLNHLKEETNLRVLDIGPTSPNNINFLTNMGHSVYMADFVQEALQGGWNWADSDERGESFAGEEFSERSLNFHGRCFDVVLLWTVIDYLPEQLISVVISRIFDSMEPGGKVLAFFHTRKTGADTAYCRYHLVDSTNIDTQENEPHAVLHVSTNREIERLFKDFAGCKFFLARDNVYEVILTR